MDKSITQKLFDFDLKPNAFRLIFGIFSIFLLAIIILNFYHYGSIPTDENWYFVTPSKFYVTKSFTALKLERSFEKSESIKHTADSIRVGHLIFAINDKVVAKYKNLDQFYKSIPNDSVLKMTVFPLEYRKAEFEYIVKRTALPDSFVRQLPNTAHVFDVIKGGASDRAGMKVGDLIVRINNRTFNDIYEADKIMKSARAGKTIDYDVIRNNKTITLHVTLARFGLDPSILISFICGLFILGFGIFLGMKSPHLKAGRLLSLAFLSLGFYIGTRFDLKIIHPQNELLFLVRNSSIFFCFGFGIAWWLSSAYFFPKQWVEILKYRWIRYLPYIFAWIFVPVSIVLYMFFDFKLNRYFDYILVSALVYNLFIHLIFRKQRSVELRKLSRGIARTVYIGCFSIIALNFLLYYNKLPGLKNYSIIISLLIPIAYLYTIGRYHLLDINLHIRKNIQYSIWSTGWAISVIAIFLALFVKLLSLNLNIPRFRLTFTSFEILEGSMASQHRAILEKAILMIFILFVGIVLWKIRQWGQKIIDRKYYRTQFDYQNFSRNLAEVMATRLGITDLAQSIVHKLTELMHLKRSAIIFFRDGETCCYQAAYGLNEIESGEFFINIDQKFVQFVHEFRTDSRLSVDYLPTDMQNYLHENGFRHIIPIWFKDKLDGVLLIGERLSETPFHTEDLSFFTTVAKQASVSIENAFLYEQLAEKERLKHELEIARQIQLASLPQSTPQIKGIDIAGISIPAAEVGGDYFDYLNGVPDTVTVIVGDVSGKGTSAALYLFKIQGILRSLYGFGLMPRELFIRANQLLYRDLEKKSFVTAIGGYFDSKNRRLILARAGHLPLFYFQTQSQKVIKITPKGLGLGLDEQNLFSSEIEEKSIHYEKDDIFVFITDGITEAKNTDGNEFGEDKLEAVLERNHLESAKIIRDKIIKEVSQFSNNIPQHDDQTVVVVKVNFD